MNQNEHEYMHAHGIPHSHDGEGHEHHHDHEHPHDHEHHHDHEHPHDHGHHHEHPHDHAHCDQGSCAGCAGCGDVDPKTELIALMKYMVGHNALHANELAQLAKQLQDLGETTAYEQIMLAVSDFEKGNLRLSTVLAAMNA